MVIAQDWLSPTRLTGLIAYSASLSACMARWLLNRKSFSRDGLFAVLAAVQFCLLIDMALDLRWKLHEFWMQEAMSMGVYGLRRMPQAVAMAILLFMVVLAVVAIRRRLRGRTGAELALTGTLLSATLWCFEWISFHWLDQILYHSAGPVMVVSVLWIGLAIVTCLGAWLDGVGHFSKQPPGQDASKYDV